MDISPVQPSPDPEGVKISDQTVTSGLSQVDEGWLEKSSRAYPKVDNRRGLPNGER
jgi:hypothetical protein